MKYRYLFPALMSVAIGVGCNRSMTDDQQPAAEQSATYEMLMALEATIALDNEGYITAVDLDGAQGDEVLDLLFDIPTLKSIGLSGSSVTDAGVAKLATLTSLQAIGLEDTSIRRATVAKLREALPDCVIAYGEGDE